MGDGAMGDLALLAFLPAPFHSIDLTRSLSSSIFSLFIFFRHLCPILSPYYRENVCCVLFWLYDRKLK
jgi:hypothetical protein